MEVKFITAKTLKDIHRQLKIEMIRFMRSENIQSITISKPYLITNEYHLRIMTK